MYLVASPDKSQSPDITSTIARKPEWTEEAVELFKGLTGDDKPLRGIMIPWDSTTYQQVPFFLEDPIFPFICAFFHFVNYYTDQVYYPAASCSFADITYQRPTLVLQLYDTTSDEDIDITQIMVETGLAELVDEIVKGKNDLLGCINRFFLKSNVSLSLSGGKVDQENIARVLHLSVNDLENTADKLDKEG